MGKQTVFKPRKFARVTLEKPHAATISGGARQPLAVACAACFNLIVRGTGAAGLIRVRSSASLAARGERK